MNSYADFYGVDAPACGARMQDTVAVGDAIGSMVAATVFGMTRAMDELDSDARAVSTPDTRLPLQRRWLRAPR